MTGISNYVENQFLRHAKAIQNEEYNQALMSTGSNRVGDFVEALTHLACETDLGSVSAQVLHDKVQVESLRPDGVSRAAVSRMMIERTGVDLTNLAADVLIKLKGFTRRSFCPKCDTKIVAKNDYLCEGCRYGI